MANEKENVTKSVLTKEVSFMRRWYDFTDDNGVFHEGESIVCTCTVAGEAVRFKVDKADAKLLRVLMKMHGYPLYEKDGVTIRKEDAFNAEI